MSTCNYCTLKSIKSRAKEKGEKAVVLQGNFFEMGGGFDVYTCPKDVKISKLTVAEREKYFNAWLMEIPDHCCC